MVGIRKEVEEKIPGWGSTVVWCSVMKLVFPGILRHKAGIWEHEMLHCILSKALLARLHAALLVLSYLTRNSGFTSFLKLLIQSSQLSHSSLLLCGYLPFCCFSRVMVISCCLGNSVESHSSFWSPFASPSCCLGLLVTGVHLWPFRLVASSFQRGLPAELQ